MSFWTTEKGSEPKRNYRFKVQFPGLISANQGAQAAPTDIVWWAKKVTKPAFTVGETTHKLLNHTFHFPSTVTWEPVTLTMVDPINPSTTNLMMNLLQTAGYKLPGQTLSEGTVNKALMGVALGAINIIHLDADGSALETWTLKNAFIKSVKFSDLDYDSEDLSTCDIEVRYDWAELVTAQGTGVKPDTTTPLGPVGSWNWATTAPSGDSE